MTGFLKILLLLCAVSKQNASEVEENCKIHLEALSKPPSLRSSSHRACGIRNCQLGSDCDKEGVVKYRSHIWEFPWTVAVLKSGNYSFVGTLIHPRVVLTAAHRVENGETYTVRAGEWNIKSTNWTQKHQEIEVQRVIKHPAFRMDNFQNDVALLILEQWFKLDDYINVICLPEHEAYPPPKSQCYANGWGKDGFADLELFNGIMKRIPLHTVNYSSCQDSLRNSNSRSEFSMSKSILCAEGEVAFNVFHGDGGGPLACPFGNPQENRYQLTGILISLVRCNSDWTVVTANVAWVRNWIDQEITAIGFDKSYYSAGSSLLTN
ncbi:phenoloxidase-activating factor 2 [Drosophila erecta]|uniref:phenoloxidase-activating factor 2 n=1 Tax=Drosophila erecta TaxID=7220 RepID=UPI0007327290|nr:phenoloxidase-activating factor 2 [Drosophila erecta]KQS39427.1 uncharacterized protein Dere_GG15532 [Drosophila erecta]